jgi:hypothetical protein
MRPDSDIRRPDRDRTSVNTLRVLRESCSHSTSGDSVDIDNIWRGWSATSTGCLWRPKIGRRCPRRRKTASGSSGTNECGIDAAVFSPK